MSKFVISDLHLGHKSILAHCRPEFESVEDMHEVIIKNWNSVVTPRDKVYILGDVTLSKKNLPILDELNGTKTLVMGNHDMERLAQYQKYF